MTMSNDAATTAEGKAEEGNDAMNSCIEEASAAIDTATENREETPEETKVDPSGDDWIPVFVNQGLRRWEENRALWLGKQQYSDDSNSTARAAVELDVDDVIDLIFSQRWRHPERARTNFPQPVPLPQMVDILVDLWEAEGLDM